MAQIEETRKTLKEEDLVEFSVRTRVLGKLAEQCHHLQEQINDDLATANLLDQVNQPASPVKEMLLNGCQLEIQTSKERLLRLQLSFDMLSVEFSTILATRYQLGDGEEWSMDLEQKVLVRVTQAAGQKQEKTHAE